MQVKPSHVSDVIYAKMQEYSYFVGGNDGNYLRVTQRSNNKLLIRYELPDDVTGEQIDHLGSLFTRILAMTSLGIPAISVDGALHDAASKNVELEK